jgi:NADH-quinone oxidoreductase subunit I
MELLAGLYEAFRTTLVEMFKKPVTYQYPEQKRKLPPRARWRIVLTRDPDNQERCVGCYLCSAWKTRRTGGGTRPGSG